MADWQAISSDSERLIGVLGDVLAGVREALGLSEAECSDGTSDPIEKVYERRAAPCFRHWRPAEAWSSCPRNDAISAHHGNNHAPLMERFHRSARPALFNGPGCRR